MKDRRTKTLAILLIGALLFAACGGDDSSDLEGASSPVDSTGSDTPDTPDTPDVDLPKFVSDFDRVCTTQVGFAGATPLSDGAAGPRPIAVFQETDSGSLITTSFDLPAGWEIENDNDYDNNDEVAPIELVGCSTVTAQTPNGVSCDLEGDDDEVITLGLVDQSFELNVYEAVTGELLGTETIDAADADCPMFVFVDEGQTEYFNTPDADQYINALKAYVTP